MSVNAYARKETFLARYPRNLKLLVAGVFVLLLCSPLFVPQNRDKASSFKETPANKGETQNNFVQKETKAVSLASTKPETKRVIDRNAAAINDLDDRDKRMAHAPDPDLTETTAQGELPRIGDSGRKVWQVYARPFNFNDMRPRVAIVIMDMGLSKIATDTTLRRLPASVTMAFNVESPVVAAWLNRARQDGHETLLSLPMEPFDYPRSDPGSNALLTNLPNNHNVERLLWALRRGTGYVGVTTLSGSRFISDPAKVGVLLDVLKQRGLLIFDSRVSPRSVVTELAQKEKVPVATDTLFVDKDPSPAAINAALTQLEQAAQINGHAIGIATPLPVTLDHLEAWIKTLPAHGVVLAPVSAMVE